MCSHDCHASKPAVEPALKPSRRIKLWDLKGGLQCSIIGTCLGHQDLLWLAAKNNVRIHEGAADYDVHSYFVQQAGKPVSLARALHKVLEHRYAGIVRKVGVSATNVDLIALWNLEFEAGRIPGAYWAFLSHTHVSAELSSRIFGEVHMLSHVLGRTTHQTASRASELAARIDDLEAKTARQAERNRVLAKDRDAALARYEAELAIRQEITIAAHAVAPLPASLKKSEPLRIQRQQRTLVATRERARGAELQIARLQEEVKRLKLWVGGASVTPAPPCPAAVACDEVVRSDLARRIVYIGGRSGSVDGLKRIALRASAELIHHDGGEEQNVTRIDGLIENCDAVFCPMNCISHSACLRAKALCKKFQVPFVPLRSAGAASFERALNSLTASR